MKIKIQVIFALFFISALFFINSCEDPVNSEEIMDIEPLQITHISFQNTPLTCRDNSFYITFNHPIDTCYTEKGPIVSIDTLTYIVNSKNDMIFTHHPINCLLTLENGGKSLKITLDNNFNNDDLLYYLNINLSRLTDNENYDRGFSFFSHNVAKIFVHSGPDNDLKPKGDTIHYYRPDRIISLNIPEKNENFKFNKWICMENATIFSDLGISDTLPTIQFNLTCEISRPELNFFPLYDKIQ